MIPGRMTTGLGRAAVVAVMLVGGFSAAVMPAAAQGDSATDTGFSSTHGETGSWSVSWNSADWDNNEDGIGDSEIDLFLERAGTFVHFYEIVDTDDAATCLAEVVPLFEETVGLTDSAPLLNDDGDPIGFANDVNSREVREVSGEVGGDDLDGYEYASCWEIEEGATAVFAGAVVSADAAEEDLPLLDGLYAEVRTYLDGEEIGEARGTEEATLEPDDPDATTGADEDAGTYTSPTFGFTTAWDPDDWTVDGETLGADADGRDILSLTETDGSSILYFEGGTNWAGDLDACLAQLLADLDVDPETSPPLEDPETGDAFTIDTDDRLAAGYLVTPEVEDAREVAFVVGCQRLGDDDSDLVVGVTHISNETGDYFDEDYALFEELLDNAAPGEVTAAETPDATPAASDDGGSITDAGDFYLSPTYLYFLEWDESYWTPLGMSSDDEGTDILTLIADDLHADLVGYVNGDGDVETCLDDYIAIVQEDAPDAAILETDDGPSVEISDDGTMLTAMIVSTDGEVGTATLFTCTRISDEAVVRLSVTGDSDTVVAERDAIQALLDGLLVIPVTE